MIQRLEKRLTDQQVQQLTLLFDQGYTVTSLAEIFDVERDKVLAITFGLARKDASGWTLKNLAERNARLGRNTAVPYRFRRQITPEKLKEAQISLLSRSQRRRRNRKFISWPENGKRKT